MTSTKRENIKPSTETGSTTPITERTGDKTPSISTEKACIAAPIDQTVIASAYPFLVPILSMKFPTKRTVIA